MSVVKIFWVSPGGVSLCSALLNQLLDVKTMLYFRGKEGRVVDQAPLFSTMEYCAFVAEMFLSSNMSQIPDGDFYSAAG